MGGGLDARPGSGTAGASHGGATQPHIGVVVKAAALVIVALAALAFLVAVGGGYLANMQAFNDLAAMPLP